MLDRGSQLERLIEAHRPMVVRMAMSMWRGDIKLNVLVEYGMFGLRLAAEPPRPSKTKKGQTVGFDPAKGSFSSYARSYAERRWRKQSLEELTAIFSPKNSNTRRPRRLRSGIGAAPACVVSTMPCPWSSLLWSAEVFRRNAVARYGSGRT